jgi:adenosylcobinamide-GDP ribazoletransferase
MVLAVAVFPYARSAGLGRLYHDHSRPWPLTYALVLAVAAAVVLFGAGGLLLCLIAFAATLGIGAFMDGRIGGLTGDTYGAIGVLVELLLLYVAAAAMGGDWLRPRFDL